MNARLVAVFLLLGLTLVGCSTSEVRLDSLEIGIPEGWQVTRRGSDNLQMADGTAGEGTEDEAGTATAVFDLYLDREEDPDRYREGLGTQGVEVSTEELTVDGRDVLVFTLQGRAVAGWREVVLVPAEDVMLVYRAAFPDDDRAFFDRRDAFREAVSSMRFSAPAA